MYADLILFAPFALFLQRFDFSTVFLCIHIPFYLPSFYSHFIYPRCCFRTIRSVCLNSHPCCIFFLLVCIASFRFFFFFTSRSYRGSIKESVFSWISLSKNRSRNEMINAPQDIARQYKLNVEPSNFTGRWILPINREWLPRRTYKDFAGSPKDTYFVVTRTVKLVGEFNSFSWKDRKSVV